MSARRGSLLGLLAGLWAGARGPGRETREFYAAYRAAEGLPAVGVDAVYEREVIEKATCVHLS